VTDTATATTLANEAARWSVDEADETVIIVRRLDDLVLVEWDDAARGWACSACGEQRSGSSAPITCEHIVAAGRGMSLATALELVATLAPSRGGRPVGKTTSLSRQERDTARAEAEILAAGAEARARRAAEHDATHADRTSEIHVRQMTDEDRVKLEARREAKRKAYEHTPRMVGFRG
jgi:hypothetical protein